MEFRIEHIAGKTCRIWNCGHDGSVIYWGTARRDDNEETAVAELLKEMTKGKSWTLVAYEVEHWNQDFSPWAVPSVFGQEEFTGGAKETMDWLIDQCIPFVEGNLTTDCSARLIGGYSLAGLFSLFTFYESGEFNGVASSADRYGIRDGKNMRSASMRRNEALCISASDKRKKRRATGKWLLLVR